MFETDDMRQVFFADFGEDVIFHPSSADSFTVTGNFDQRPLAPRAVKGAQVGYDEGAKILGNAPEFRCRTTDIEGKITPGSCRATVRGREYNVFSAKPDYTGMSLVILKVA